MTTNGDWKAIADGGLRYFGSVSASVSHDIRNRFAVINEKAGLLEDMTTMMIEGRAIDLERMRTQARKVNEQVHLANQIIRNLNAFAHTVDTPQKTVDVAALLTLVATLSARKAAAANASIDTSGLRDDIQLTTMPFFLGTLIGHCFDIGLAGVDDGGTIAIAAESIDGGVRITFGHVSADESETGLAEPGAAVVALLELLEGHLRIDLERSELLLEVLDLAYHENGGQP
jgi:hypothetical protein